MADTSTTLNTTSTSVPDVNTLAWNTEASVQNGQVNSTNLAGTSASTSTATSAPDLSTGITHAETPTYNGNLTETGQSAYDYQNAYYDAVNDATIQNYQNQFNQAYQTQANANADIGKTYQASAADIANQYDIAYKNMGLSIAQNGLNTGLGSQMQLSLTNSRAQSLAANEVAHAQAVQAGEQALVDLELEYRTAIAEAISNNDLTKAQALYEEIMNDENRKLTIASTMAEYGDFSGYEDIYGSDTASEMQAAYDAAKQEAKDLENAEYLAQMGDFNALADYYDWTDEQYANAYTQWLFANPGYAYWTGKITAADYYAITGALPTGSTSGSSYYSGGSSGSGGGGGGDSTTDTADSTGSGNSLQLQNVSTETAGSYTTMNLSDSERAELNEILATTINSKAAGTAEFLGFDTKNSEIVYSMGGSTYRASYSTDKDGNIILNTSTDENGITTLMSNRIDTGEQSDKELAEMAGMSLYDYSKWDENSAVNGTSNDAVTIDNVTGDYDIQIGGNMYRLTDENTLELIGETDDGITSNLGTVTEKEFVANGGNAEDYGVYFGSDGLLRTPSTQIVARYLKDNGYDYDDNSLDTALRLLSTDTDTFDERYASREEKDELYDSYSSGVTSDGDRKFAEKVAEKFGGAQSILATSDSIQDSPTASLSIAQAGIKDYMQGIFNNEPGTDASEIYDCYSEAEILAVANEVTKGMIAAVKPEGGWGSTDGDDLLQDLYETYQQEDFFNDSPITVLLYRDIMEFEGYAFLAGASLNTAQEKVDATVEYMKYFNNALTTADSYDEARLTAINQYIEAHGGTATDSLYFNDPDNIYSYINDTTSFDLDSYYDWTRDIYNAIKYRDIARNEERMSQSTAGKVYSTLDTNYSEDKYLEAMSYQSASKTNSEALKSASELVKEMQEALKDNPNLKEGHETFLGGDSKTAYVSTPTDYNYALNYDAYNALNSALSSYYTQMQGTWANDTDTAYENKKNRAAAVDEVMNRSETQQKFIQAAVKAGWDNDKIISGLVASGYTGATGVLDDAEKKTLNNAINQYKAALSNASSNGLSSSQAQSYANKTYALSIDQNAGNTGVTSGAAYDYWTSNPSTRSK